MPCLEGVVSVQSFENLEWLYTGHLRFPLKSEKEKEQEVTALVELARLADMCHINGLELELAQGMTRILLGNEEMYQATLKLLPGLNTSSITKEHTISAMCLPEKHPVRDVLALASIEGYLRVDDFRLSEVFRECPIFAADLLERIRPVCASVTCEFSVTYFKDPLSGALLSIT